LADPRDLEQLRAAAVALQELTEELVFVGGTITSLLITDPAAPPTRRSDDVDTIVQATLQRYYELGRRLKAIGFTQKPEQPVCRWFRGDLVIDVMPDNADILGFTNRWYASAYRAAELVDVGGVKIRVIAPVWFLATKFEAFDGRGHGDYQASRDVEDIVAVVDGRASLVGEIALAPYDVQAYVRDRIRGLLQSQEFVVSLAGHLAGETSRVALLLERLDAIASRP
jgi:hypothetical protein